MSARPCSSPSPPPPRDAAELGFLLQKHPDRVFRRELSVGTAKGFYPEATAGPLRSLPAARADPVKLARDAQRHGGGNGYAAAKPYLAGSLLAVALGRCFNSAIAGRAKEKVERLTERWPVTVRLPALPCRGGADAVRAAWNRSGYACEAVPHPLDPDRPAWGDAAVHEGTLTGSHPIPAVLNHLAVLLPALEGDRHHFVDAAEVDKLVRRGGEWLADHPHRDRLVAFSLKRQPSLIAQALDRLDALAEPRSDQESNQEEEGPPAVAAPRDFTRRCTTGGWTRSRTC